MDQYRCISSLIHSLLLSINHDIQLYTFQLLCNSVGSGLNALLDSANCINCTLNTRFFSKWIVCTNSRCADLRDNYPVCRLLLRSLQLPASGPLKYLPTERAYLQNSYGGNLAKLCINDRKARSKHSKIRD